MKQLRTFQLKYPVRKEGAYALLKLTPTDGEPLPPMHGGQFVNILVTASHDTFLRRPISVNYVDNRDNTLWLLVADAGPATHALCNARMDERFSILLPLGNGFAEPEQKSARLLLCGGGVGIAPMLEWSRELREKGFSPRFLLSGRSQNYLPELEMFGKYGEVDLCTDDGSAGLEGFPTQHPALAEAELDMVYCCGPMPMMRAVAEVCRSRGIRCQVSLENKMACGLGACLCCVENTRHGNTCVCTQGPVFDTEDLILTPNLNLI